GRPQRAGDDAADAAEADDGDRRPAISGRRALVRRGGFTSCHTASANSACDAPQRLIYLRRGRERPFNFYGGSPCASIGISTTSPAFSITRKRRKSFPSETQVRRGDRVVHGNVELTEKLGRNDLCPCGSGHRFQTLLHGFRTLRRHQPRLLLSGNESGR